MFPFKTILHPTDFSANAEPAFLTACSLAEMHDALLILLHVVPPSYLPLSADTNKPGDSSENYPWPLPPNPGVRVEHRLAEGESAPEILALALSGSCDVIVMGTQGRTGLSRLLVGSVAEEVLRNAKCPVLTVKCAPDYKPTVKYSSTTRTCEVVNARPLGQVVINSSETRPRIPLFKTMNVEIGRLVLPERSELADRTKGETIFQCLEGKVDLTAFASQHILTMGQLLVVPGGEDYRIKGLEDASLLQFTFV